MLPRKIQILKVMTMVERKSKKRGKKTCDIDGCDKPSKRSIPKKKVMEAEGVDLKVREDKTGRDNIHLCKEHYKVYKKATKQDRKLKTLTWE